MPIPLPQRVVLLALSILAPCVSHTSSAQVSPPNVATCKAQARDNAEHQRAALKNFHGQPLSKTDQRSVLDAIADQQQSREEDCDRAFQNWLALHPDSVAAQMAQAHLKNQQVTASAAERKMQQNTSSAEAALHPPAQPAEPDVYFVGVAQDDERKIRYYTPTFVGKDSQADACTKALTQVLRDQFNIPSSSPVQCNVYDTKDKADYLFNYFTALQDPFVHRTFNWSYTAPPSRVSNGTKNQYSLDYVNLYNPGQDAFKPGTGSETIIGKPYGCMAIATPQSVVRQSSACGGGPGALNFSITNNDAIAVDCAFSYEKKRDHPRRDGVMLAIAPHSTQSDWTCGAVSTKVVYTCYAHDARAKDGRLCVAGQTF